VPCLVGAALYSAARENGRVRTVPFAVNDPQVRAGFFHPLLVDILASLEADERPRWGAMTAQQMVEHLQWGFEVSTGRVVLECPVPEAKRARMKPFLFNDTPMIHDFRNPALAAGLPALRHPGLPEARAGLAGEVGRFLDYERSSPGAVHTHPVFGPITVEEWARAHFKHAYHHLLQFGLIERP
jgi:oxepin-CoA hydrolase / 3-oxo-5,6-dehydrosuberyl-CoA semialdehyde dehydrogenase